MKIKKKLFQPAIYDFQLLHVHFIIRGLVSLCQRIFFNFFLFTVRLITSQKKRNVVYVS